MTADEVNSDEILYRCVKPEFITLVDGRWRCSENAFRDRDKEPSVDRAKFCEFNPEYTRREVTDSVASLSAQGVRDIKGIVQRSNTGNTILHEYTVDVRPDPIKDDEEFDDNPAHAKIHTDKEMSSNPFKRLKEELAALADIVLEAGNA